MKPVDESYQQLAARYLRRQVKQLAAQIEGIRKAEDVEPVHRARVAARRLSSGLEVFADCFPADQVKGWRKAIRAVGRELGDARDRDVQISWLTATIARLPQPEFYAGVARVLDRCQRKREKLQPKVLAGMNALSSTRALHQMLLATKKMLPDGKKGDLLTPSPELLDLAERQVLARLEQFLALKDCLADPNDRLGHHTMRIAGKQLRYTVEIYRPLHAGRIDAVLNAMKQLQTFFGDVHDCDVWIEQFAEVRDQQSKRIKRLFGHTGPFARLEPGIRYLEEDRLRCRREIFQSLVEYWGSQAGLWDELTRIVHSREPITPIENRLTVHCD